MDGRAGRRGGGAGHYRFAHALVREALIAGLSGTRRALLHRRMAEVLAALPGRAPAAGAGATPARRRPLVDAAAAASCALRAAEEAKRTLAYEDAAELLARAARRARRARPAARRAAARPGRRRQRLGDAPAADRGLEEAVREARALGDGELLARAALATAGLTVSVGPVRDEVRALLEEALAAVEAASELRPRLLARLAIEVYYAPPPTLRERLSDEALRGGPAHGRAGAARGARRPARGALDPRSHRGASRHRRRARRGRAGGGRSRGRAAGHQLARGRPVRAGRASRRCGRRSPTTSSSPRTCACPPTTGTCRCGGRARAARRTAGRGAAAVRGGRCASDAAPTTTTPSCSSRSSATASTARRAHLRRGLRPHEGARPATRPPAGLARRAPGADAPPRRRRGRARARSDEVAALKPRRSTPTGSTPRRRSACWRPPRRRAGGGRAVPAARAVGHRIVTVGRGCMRARVGGARARAAGRDARRPRRCRGAPRAGGAAQRRARRASPSRRPRGTRSPTCSTTRRAERLGEADAAIAITPPTACSGASDAARTQDSRGPTVALRAAGIVAHPQTRRSFHGRPVHPLPVPTRSTSCARASPAR